MKRRLIPLLLALCLLMGLSLPPAAAASGPMPLPTPGGTAVQSGGGAEIDYSNTKDGYVMVRFAADSSKRLRVQVKGPATTYTYELPPGKWITFPLSDGNGAYQVTAFQNTSGKKYAVLTSVSFQVALTDEFAPFLRPNQFVDYASAPNTVQKAKDLTANITAPLEKVGAVYNFVVGNLTYEIGRAHV